MARSALCGFLLVLGAVGCVDGVDDEPRTGTNEQLGGVVGCTSTSTSASPASPQAGGTTVTLTHGAVGCANPQFLVWLYPPGGPWSMLQDWTASTETAWNTAGAALGTSYLQVWAREQGSPAAYDAWTGFPYELTNGSAPCTSVTPSFTASTVDGAATCGGNPEYQFYVYPPGGPWAVLQGWSAASSASTTGLLDDSQIQIWARNQGSTAGYEATASVTYYTSPVCDVAVMAVEGNPLRVYAGAGCQGLPEYRYWMYPPGGPWIELSDWTRSSDIPWDTTALADGSYYFQVWARAQGTTTDLDAWAGVYYQKVPCANADVVADVNPVVAGAPVTLTSTSEECDSPYYTLYMLPPGGSWAEVQASSPTAQYLWDTTGAAPGTYYFQSWAKQLTSSELYDSVGYIAVDVQ